MTKKENISNIILSGMFVFAILTSMLLLCHMEKPEEYQLLFLLPSTFSIIMLIFLTCKKNILDSIVKTILTCGYFVRSTITPFVMRFGNYSSKVTNESAFENMDKAIFLMCFEIILVFLIIFVKKTKARKQENQYKNKLSFKTKNLLIIIISLIIITVAFLLIYPDLKEVYGFFLFYNIEQITIHDIAVNNLIESLPPLVYPIYKIIVDVLRELIPIYLVLIIKDKWKQREGAGFWVSIIIIGISLLFMSDDKAVSLYLAIALMLMLGYLYPTYIKKSIKLGVIIAIIISIVLFGKDTTSSESENFMESASDSLQAYFGGIDNVAVALNLTPFHLDRLPINTGKSITIVAYFFRQYDSMSYIFNTEFHGYSGRTNHIIPLIGEGYYYFGYLASGLLHFTIISLAIYMEKKSHRTENMLKKYICTLACIILSITPIMYNWVICTNLFTSLIIPIMVIYKISSKKVEE